MASIRTKALALIAVLTIIPGVVLVGVLRVRLDRVVETQTLDIASQFMKLNAGYLESYLNEVENTFRYITDTRVVREAIENDRFVDTYEALLVFRTVADEIAGMVAFRPEIGQLEIHAENGFSYRSGLPGFHLFSRVRDAPQYAPVFDASSGVVWFIAENARSLVIGRRLTPSQTDRPIGVAFAHVPLHRVENILGRFRDGRDRELLLLHREDGVIIGRRTVPVDIREYVSGADAGGSVTIEKAVGGFYVVSTPIGAAGLDLVMVVSAASMLRGSLDLQWFMVISILVVMLLTAAAWVRFSYRVIGPIRRLATTIEQFGDGSTNVPAVVETDDEIGELARTYNRMLERLNQLIEEVYVEQIHRRDAEWDALQAQINPHFLNNTLNSIGALARLKGADDITRMVGALSRMFSMVVYENCHEVPLSKELEYVRLYTQIQKIRFGSRLTVTVDVPEELEKLSIPRFSLQPLVENAIIHGIEPSAEGGEVRVTAWTERGGEHLVLEVCDTGVGLEPETLRRVRETHLSSVSRIGLRNIDERIRTRSGSQFGLTIDSRLGTGTTVTVRLPSSNGSRGGPK